MSKDSMSPVPARRSFLARFAAGVAAFGVGGVSTRVDAMSDVARDSGVPQSADEPWMSQLAGTQRVIFHAHEPTAGLALRWAQTFLDTQKSSYGRSDKDCGVVVGLNGKSIGLVFNDTLWGKYPVGETLSMPGNVNPAGPSGSNAVAQLIARGVIILVCRNSLRAAGQRFLPAGARDNAAARTAFGAEATNNLLPGVEIVPAMVTTLQMAQDRGCRYVYAGG